MKPQKLTRFDEELGKAICDRLGLPHNRTLQEYSAESAGKTVWVTMTVMEAIPVDEFNGMRKTAIERSLT